MHQAHIENHHHYRCFARDPRGRMVRGIVWGATVVSAGVLFLLEQLGMLGGYHAWSFWPVLLIIAGVMGMTRRYHRLFGTALAVTGTLLLVHSLALGPLQWGVIWPILIIGLGVVILISIMTRKRRPHVPPFARNLPPGAVHMGSKEERVDTQEYEGGEVSSVMGAYLLDLTRAEIKGEVATVSAKAVMGAIEIRVPRHWKVQVESSPVLGAVDDRTHEPVDPTKILVIEADVVLGGIEIRN